MLYLNSWAIIEKPLPPNLTLTNVVFESMINKFGGGPVGLFNFNKCCIWIR